jgi:hypothetical protein
MITDLRHKFSEIKNQLEAYRSDLTILQRLNTCDVISEIENDELQRLISLETLDIRERMQGQSRDWLRKRQKYWNYVARSASNPTKQTIARYAVERLGSILFTTEKQSH